MKTPWKTMIPGLLFFAALSISLQPASAQDVPTASIYKDVPADHYANKEIVKLSQMGVIEGTADGAFQPDEQITRGVAALWLSKALKLPDPTSLKGFTDIPENSPFAKAVNALKEKGIVQGDGGQFNPNEPLTREQMASLLVRAFNLKDNGMNVWFQDESSIGTSHYDDVIRLKQHYITDQSDYMPKNKVTRAQLVLFLNRAASFDQQEDSLIPLEDFLRGNDRLNYEIAPNGKKVAYLKLTDSNHIQLYAKSTDKKDGTLLTTLSDREIIGYFWFNNDKLVYITDLYGTENYHIHSVNADGSDDKDLTPYENTRAEFMDDISYLDGHENDILIRMNKRSPYVLDVYRLNVQTGSMEMIAQNPGNITHWLSDIYGIVKLAIAREGTNAKVLYRATERESFKPVLDVAAGDTFSPIMFTLDGSKVYALSNIGFDKKALVEFNVKTKELSEPIYVNENADVTDFVFSYKKNAILAVKYETDKVNYHFLDKEFEQLHQKIASKLSGSNFRILGNPLPDTKVYLRTYSDTSAGAYYYYNRKTDELEKIEDIMPWLDESKMAKTKPVEYTSRDGFTIHGYLTIPRGVESKNLPTVILPHGGPWSRDSWGFDSEVQLLASRGYAVLQMNFRGSIGYGKKFMNAGNKQWGKAMQNDITDGVQWLIQQGIADPRRIAIYGASYGGYAALAGMTFTPDLYAAGVDFMGPSSLSTFLKTMPAYWEPDREVMYSRVGHPDKDAGLMEESSPLHHADQIKAPILFVQGVYDPRVNKKESDQMVMALRNRGVDVSYMIKDGEGHGFQYFRNQVDFYTALLKFLDKHVKNK